MSTIENRKNPDDDKVIQVVQGVFLLLGMHVKRPCPGTLLDVVAIGSKLYKVQCLVSGNKAVIIFCEMDKIPAHLIGRAQEVVQRTNGSIATGTNLRVSLTKPDNAGSVQKIVSILCEQTDSGQFSKEYFNVRISQALELIKKGHSL
jgi:hypothetical protein